MINEDTPTFDSQCQFVTTAKTKLKELSLCHKIKFSNANIFAT